MGFFFFAARCCEYCKTAKEGKTKRVQIGDLRFLKTRTREVEIDEGTDLSKVKYVSITFRDQKNGRKMETRTQGRTGDPVFDPVLRLASAVRRIKRNVSDWKRDTDICTIGKRANVLRLTDKIVLETIRSVCRIGGGKDAFGFGPDEIGNRSLRSGAAMTLALSKKNWNSIQIMILGRWNSDAFMRYLRPQVLELTSDMAADMIEISGTDLGQ